EILAGGDVWDHRYLRDAIDLDARLDNFSGGLDAQLGNATGLEFFRLVTADPVTLAHVGPFLSQPRSDVLIALVLAAAPYHPRPRRRPPPRGHRVPPRHRPRAPHLCSTRSSTPSPPC